MSEKSLKCFLEIVNNEKNFNLNELTKLILNYSKILNHLNYSIKSLTQNLDDLKKIYSDNLISNIHAFKQINNFKKDEVYSESQINYVNLARIEIYLNKKIQM